MCLDFYLNICKLVRSYLYFLLPYEILKVFFLRNVALQKISTCEKSSIFWNSHDYESSCVRLCKVNISVVIFHINVKKQMQMNMQKKYISLVLYSNFSWKLKFWSLLLKIKFESWMNQSEIQNTTTLYCRYCHQYINMKFITLLQKFDGCVKLVWLGYISSKKEFSAFNVVVY